MSTIDNDLIETEYNYSCVTAGNNKQDQLISKYDCQRGISKLKNRTRKRHKNFSMQWTDEVEQAKYKIRVMKSILELMNDSLLQIQTNRDESVKDLNYNLKLFNSLSKELNEKINEIR